MEKSVYSHEYSVLLQLLVEKRKDSGVTQVQLAKEIDTTQSIVSKMERGEVRIDVVQLLRMCNLFGIKLSEFITEFEVQIKKKKRRKKRS